MVYFTRQEPNQRQVLLSSNRPLMWVEWLLGDGSVGRICEVCARVASLTGCYDSLRGTKRQKHCGQADGGAHRDVNVMGNVQATALSARHSAVMKNCLSL